LNREAQRWFGALSLSGRCGQFVQVRAGWVSCFRRASNRQRQRQPAVLCLPQRVDGRCLPLSGLSPPGRIFELSPKKLDYWELQAHHSTGSATGNFKFRFCKTSPVNQSVQYAQDSKVTEALCGHHTMLAGVISLSTPTCGRMPGGDGDGTINHQGTTRLLDDTPEDFPRIANKRGQAQGRISRGGS
jgi:hypothetical protein